MKRAFLLGVCIGVMLLATSAHLRTAAQVVTRSSRPAKNYSISAADDGGRPLRFSGETVMFLPDGRIELGSLTNELRDRNGVEIKIRAPHAIVDQKQKIVYSPGELSLQTSDARLAIQGRGYLFRFGETRLALSNDVRTVLRRRFALTAVSAAPRSNTTHASTDSDSIQILSDELDYRPELAVFTGHVRAKEPEGSLSSGKLTAHFSSEGTNRLERILAEQDVVIEQGTLQAKADRGLYDAAEGRGILELTGNASWRDGSREGSAEKLVLDRVRNVMSAEGRSRIKMPRENFGQSGTIFATALPQNATSGAGQFVEISSERLTANLSPTNGPIRRLEAERNVVIAFTADQTRATGGRAVYDEALGTVELTEQAVMQSDGRIVRGNKLVFDRARNVFTAVGDASLRLPISALGKTSLFAGSTGATNAVALTNQFLEVFADALDYRTNALAFRGHVRAHWLEGAVKRGEIHSAELHLGYGERLESLVAAGGVEAWLFPTASADGRKRSAEFRSESVAVKMSATGQPDTVVAKGAVQAEQTILRPDKPLPTKTKFETEIVNAKFFSHTNRLEKMVAEQNVRIEQDGRTARGELAVFDGKTQILELTGHPSATSPEGSITNAQALLLNATNQQVRARGKFTSEWQRPPNTGVVRQTNSPSRVPP